MTSTKSQVMNEFESSLFLFFCIALQAVVLQPPPVQQVFAQLHGQVLYDIQPASLTSHDFQSIEWKRKNTTILNCWSSSRNCMNLGDSKDKVIFNFDNNKLIIKDVSESDEGDYVLNIITYNGVVKQTHVRLLVLVPVSGPQITIYKKYILPYAVNMSCRVQQGTDPIYAWFKDGQLISESTYRLFSNNSDTLLITNITEQDCGIYICSINNQLSRTEAKQQVAAEDFPVCPSSARMSTGETVACVAGVFCLISLIVLVLMARRYKNHYQGFMQIHQEQEDGNNRGRARLERWSIQSYTSNRGWNRRENQSFHLQFLEEEIQNEENHQLDPEISDEDNPSVRYVYLGFSPALGSNERQADETDESGYATVGPCR
ncbi:hepatocyte cell adhesion molecule-like isoform X2 [Protopterus annectens]|uniref:hepatocyte cell adhesion molecule-like isoform X2 n=1 Tax=Protopterus annectens TaxID=7888 RepID=UPI001CF96C2C|nr:hepatocyte cell adhesion molecule-like isoform X2 [Protopterus annectens]